MRINTVTLCGSTRFKDEFDRVNRELTKAGISAFSISFAAEKDGDGNEREPHVKEVLDLVHFNKILRSDAIVVVGDGYIGFSTAREILWAHMQGKAMFSFAVGEGIDVMNNKFDDSKLLVRVAHKRLREIAQEKQASEKLTWRGAVPKLNF